MLPGSISESHGQFVPEICKKYVYNSTGFENARKNSCAAHFFDHKETGCNQWVYDEGERTIVNDVSDELLRT